jgi:[ribosomal protein S5]-alanine N-acetyltransferase
MPTLSGPRATLRALIPSDAESLCQLLTTEPVGQFLLPPPSSVERFGRFIDWTHKEQESGRHICYGIVPNGHEHAVGLIQVRRETPYCTTAEWGFVLSEKFWGTGLFIASAQVALEFLFETAGVYRLEARTIVENGRANGALLKLGATQEGVLRRGFCRNGEHFDQFMWSIIADEWRGRNTITVTVDTPAAPLTSAAA